MKKILFSLSILACSIVMTSCDKDLDEINKDPNRPSEVPVSGVFNNANKYVMDATRGSFSSGRMALLWVQYFSQRIYTEEDRYQYRDGVNTSLYNSYYIAAKRYKSFIDIAEDPAQYQKFVAPYGKVENMVAAGRIMLAYTQLQSVDTYGDVPYFSYGSDDPDFQALGKGTEKDIDLPVFASQEKIYRDLLKELKEAASQIDHSSGTVLSAGDFIFGSTEKLSKFAHSLRLRIAMRVLSVPSLKADAQAAIDEYIADESLLMESNLDNVSLTYENNATNPAPWYAGAFLGDRRNDFAPPASLVNLLKGNTGNFGFDYRLWVFAAPVSVALQAPSNPNAQSVEKKNYSNSTDMSQYIGNPYGLTRGMAGVQGSLSSNFGSYVYQGDYAEVFMEYAEVQFLLAEAKGWNEDNYKEGVSASMEKFGVNSDSIVKFVGSLPAANQENVLTQKYISLFMQPYEAWADYRRTGFPKTLTMPGTTNPLIVPIKEAGKPDITDYVFSPVASMTDLPERMPYATVLQTTNNVNRLAAIAAQGGTNTMKTKLIWARK